MTSRMDAYFASVAEHAMSILRKMGAPDAAPDVAPGAVDAGSTLFRSPIYFGMMYGVELVSLLATTTVVTSKISQRRQWTTIVASVLSSLILVSVDENHIAVRRERACILKSEMEIFLVALTKCDDDMDTSEVSQRDKVTEKCSDAIMAIYSDESEERCHDMCDRQIMQHILSKIKQAEVCLVHKANEGVYDWSQLVCFRLQSCFYTFLGAIAATGYIDFHAVSVPSEVWHLASSCCIWGIWDDLFDREQDIAQNVCARFVTQAQIEKGVALAYALVPYDVVGDGLPKEQHICRHVVNTCLCKELELHRKTKATDYELFSCLSKYLTDDDVHSKQSGISRWLLGDDFEVLSWGA